MASISSTVGLASGIDSKSIIDQLMALEQRPKLNLLTRMDTENKKKAAYTDLQMRLTSVRLFGTQLKKPQTFRAADVKSSDENVVTGTASVGAAAGAYRLSVARLVSSQQAVSKGFGDFNKTPVGAGTITLELGGGDLRTPTKLEDLNGGEGIRRGQFRIIDRSGKSAVIDTSDAVTLDDVIKKINTSLDVSIKANVVKDAIVLTDQTGQVVSNLRVEDIGDGHAAEDLGIRQNVAAATINGEKVGGLKTSTSLAKLNDGRGVRIDATAAGPDLRVTLADGTSVDVTLAGAKTTGDIVAKISDALGESGTAEISTSGKGIRILDKSVDYSGGMPPAPIAVTALNDSHAAEDLGLLGPASASGAVEGKDVSAGVNTTLLTSLRGGQGLDLGTIRIVDRGGTAADIDLSGAATVDDVLELINASGANVVAEVNSGGNGIQITDKTDKVGKLVISDLAGTGAAQLGIAGTFDADAAHQTIHGANLQKAWFSSDTLLRDLNGGKGVPDGRFKITDSQGRTRTIAVDADGDITVGDLMKKINATGAFGVAASINANGDGLLLTDTAGGALKMKVEELNNGTAAKSLNILGTATATTVDGSWEKTIAVTATDKLEDVQKKIQDLNWGISASVINDGSGEKPYRLSLTSVGTGRAGRVVLDSGAVNLGERVLVDAQDAAVFVGSDNSTQPMLITSSSNDVAGAIRGVTLKLNGVSKEPVTVNVARNVDNVVTAAAKFVEDFNGLITQLKTYTKYDSASQTRGELLGDPTAQSVEGELYGMLNTVGVESGKYRIASDVGLRVGDGGTVEFDEKKFRDAYADDPEGVTALFTRPGGSMDADYQLSGLRNGQGIRSNPVGTADFQISTKDGTVVPVDVSELTTMGDVIDAINNAAANAGKVVASINAAGTGIDLLDKSTTGTKKLTVSTLNGSVAASDLGLLISSNGGKIQGRRLIDVNAGDKGGLGTIVEKRVNRLIDPVSGVVARASKQVDDRNDQFQSRIDSLDKIVAAKRARLERQFANMESALSNLQGQQSALNSFTPVPAAR